MRWIHALFLTALFTVTWTERGYANTCEELRSHPELERECLRISTLQPPKEFRTSISQALSTSDQDGRLGLLNYCAQPHAVSAPDLRAFLLRVAAEPSLKVEKPLVFSEIAISGRLDLSGAEFPFSVSFESSIFCGDLNLVGSTLSRNFNVKSSVFLFDHLNPSPGLIVASDMTVGGNFEVTSSQVGAAILRDADIEGRFSFNASKVGHLSFRAGSAGSVELTNTKQLAALSKLTGDSLLNFAPDEATRRLRTAGYPSVFVASTLHFSGASIAGQFIAIDLISEGAILLNDTDVLEVRMRRAQLGAMDFRGLSSQLDVRLFGVQFIASLAETITFGCNPEVPHFKIKVLSLDGASIGRNLYLSDWHDDSGQMSSESKGLLCLSWMRVGGSIDLTGLTAASINLDHSHVARDLVLSRRGGGDLDVKQNFSAIGVTSQRIVMGSGFCFPSSINLEGAKFELVKFTNDDEPSSQILGALSEVPHGRDRASALYAFESSYRSGADTRTADDLAVSRETTETTLMPVFLRPPRWIAYVVGGYGYRPSFTLFWLISLTLVGAVVALRSREGRQFVVGQSIGGGISRRRRRIRNYFDAIVFSFDRLVPLVSVNELSKKVQFRTAFWVRVYFVGHAIMGFLLAATALGVAAGAIGIALQ